MYGFEGDTFTDCGLGVPVEYNGEFGKEAVINSLLDCGESSSDFPVLARLLRRGGGGKPSIDLFTTAHFSR